VLGLAVFNTDSEAKSVQKDTSINLKDLVLKLSKEERDLIRELAVSYYGDIPELPQIVYAIEDPALRISISKMTFNSIDDMAYYLAEYAETQYGIPIGFTENFYRIILTVLLKSKKYTSKFWHILEIGLLPEDLSILLGRDFFKKFSVIPDDLTEILHIINENRLIDFDGKNLLKATIYLAVGDFEKFKSALKSIEGSSFESYSATTALAMQTLAAIYLNYIPEISCELEGAPYKAQIVGRSWKGILETLRDGDLSDVRAYKEILEAKPYEFILISPWVYTLATVFKAVWLLRNSSHNAAIGILSKLDSLLPERPYSIKTAVLLFLTFLAREYSEERVFFHKYYKLKSLISKLIPSRELYNKLSLMFAEVFSLVDPGSIKINGLEGLRILKGTFSNSTSIKDLRSELMYIELLRKLKLSSLLYESGEFIESLSLSEEIIAESEKLRIDHILGRALIINAKSRIKLLEEGAYTSINEIIMKINELSNIIKRLEKVCTRVQNIHLKNDIDNVKRHMSLIMAKYRDVISMKRKFKGRREIIDKLLKE